MMWRLLNMADWPWADQDPRYGRFSMFLRSGELLTTLFLLASALTLVLPNSSFAQSPAFTWIAQVSHFGPGAWATAAIALSITGPLALLMNKGVLRVISVVSQGIYFVIFSLAFRARTPTGVVWILFLISGLWLLVRASLLVRHHWTRGGADGQRRAS